MVLMRKSSLLVLSVVLLVSSIEREVGAVLLAVAGASPGHSHNLS